ncbi:MAG: hypothetical protein LBE21_00335 [Pseudomonadales bacterium]|jgi:uncharacterized protein YneF (UPF0154 family)|nr:hypothetical protein [Pseudomonadales bacterium]
MVRKIVFFVLGAIIGIVICFLLAYAGSWIVAHTEIQLHVSEDEQQRNFNIFIVANLIFAALGGYLLARKMARR